MDRRSFLLRLFGKRKVRRSFFAVQVVLEAGQSGFRRRLHNHIDREGEETPAEKRKFYKGLTSILLEAQPFFEYGFFEYEVDAAKAMDQFEHWVQEIEASMATEDAEMGDEVDGFHRMSSEQQYVAVTILLVVDGPHPLEGEDLDEDTLYTRAGIGKLIDSVNRIDFERLEADAVFLMPGNDQDGFNSLDFADEGWSYLRMLGSDM
jgi:hypothetical protein